MKSQTDSQSISMYTRSQTEISSVLWNDSPNRTECPIKFHKVLRLLSFYQFIERRKDTLQRKTLFCSGYLSCLLQNVLCIHNFCFFLHRWSIMEKKESINRNRKVSAINNRLSAIIAPSLFSNRIFGGIIFAKLFWHHISNFYYTLFG